GRLSQCDESGFEVGRNLAATPGAVIVETDLLQLIQYTPVGPNVYERPLLMVPPCINKYYILDLQPQNSFVRHALEQGFSVYMVSWRNPLPDDEAPIDTATWPDYLNAIVQAIEVVKEVSRQDQINAL